MNAESARNATPGNFGIPAGRTGMINRMQILITYCVR
jgi:hypothetical protein